MRVTPLLTLFLLGGMGGAAGVPGNTARSKADQDLYHLQKRQYPKRIRHLHHQHRRPSRGDAVAEIFATAPKVHTDLPGLPPLASAALRKNNRDIVARKKIPDPLHLPPIVEDDCSTTDSESVLGSDSTGATFPTTLPSSGWH